eukprot:gnl/TRDRNA2_/TRDRNA2_136743_c1_seq1.p1 gnl/TRDRNA2_/TRDRNA2_136743_c1~~gnl/TRDRNA2_/TRDRNA2_136743_c1_seq1.p1  ORF type:complete len:487 (+),score=83.71 gnl/TRDRNA2_/TRDRNA2_136743_c1_seq1:3-1463(+)
MAAIERTLQHRLVEIRRVSSTVWANLHTAEGRIELRAQRPPEEEIRDDFQVALEQECEELKAAHQSLHKELVAAHEMVESVKKAQHDMLHATLTLPFDRSDFPAKFLDSMHKVEEVAHRFCTATTEVIKKSEKCVARTQKRTTTLMNARVKELSNMRKALYSEVVKSQSAIDEAKRATDRMRKQIGAWQDTPDEEQTSQCTDDLKLLKNAAISQDSINLLRSKIRSSSYTGTTGRHLRELFKRADKDGSGELDELEVRRLLRRTLKISPTDISDAEISAVCELVDADNSGTVSIDEIVAFLSVVDVKSIQDDYEKTTAMMKMLSESHENLLDDLRKKTHAWRIDNACVGVTAVKGAHLDQVRNTGDRKMQRRKPLEPRMVEKIRAKIRQAVDAVPGRTLEDVFNVVEMDVDDFRRILRKALQIPMYSVSETDIIGLFAMLSEADGVIGIDEIVDFVGQTGSDAVGQDVSGSSPSSSPSASFRQTGF